jgi:hypothetical protein
MDKRIFPSKRNYIDQNKVRAKKKILEALPEIIEYGTEDDVIELAKTWHPNLTPEELQELVTLFRDAKRERAR